MVGMINQRQVEAFRAVMTAGGITAAAGVLNITQPAVSRLVRDFEAHVGVPLFERRRGGRLRPTRDALTLFTEVQRYFVGFEQIMHTAQDLRRRSLGSLRVASLPALYLGLLPRFVGRFLSARPVIDLQLYGTPSDTVLDWVMSGRCDIGFVDPAYEQPGLVRRPLAAVPALAVVPVHHRLAKKSTLAAEDFADEMFVSLSRATQLRVRVDNFFTEAGVKRRLGQETPLSLIACSLVASGAGLSIVDPFTASMLSDPEVRFVPLETRIEVQFSIVTSAKAPISGAASDFMFGAEEEVQRFAQAI